MSLLAQTPGPAPAVDPPAATAGAAVSLASLKVPELKARCKALNLPHSGVKAVLLARLGSETGTPARQPPDPISPILQTDGMADPRGPAPTQYVAIQPSSKVPGIVTGYLTFEAGALITLTGKDGPAGSLVGRGRLPDGSTGLFLRSDVRLAPS